MYNNKKQRIAAFFMFKKCKILKSKEKYNIIAKLTKVSLVKFYKITTNSKKQSKGEVQDG